MKYKKYPSYKDSGVEWLGDIPEHWNVNTIKSLLEERKESNSPLKTENILSLCMYRGVIPYSEKGNSGNKAKEDLTAYKLAYPGDIVLNSMNVVAGSVGLSKYFGAVSPVYYMLRPRNKQDKVEFFNDIFQSESFQKSLFGLGNGIMVKESESTGKLNTIRMRIPMDKLNTVLIPYPPSKEQQQIVNFLDKATAKIDTLIEKQTKQIELLKEKRQAVISHAVTKGIKSNVKMKDSGVEWLGEIPEHWKVSKLRFLFSFSTGLNITKANLIDEDGIPCVNYGEIHSKYGFEVNANKDSLKYVDKEYLITSKTSLLSEGDFVFADTSEDVKGSGNFTHVVGDSKIFAGYHTVIARLINNYNSRYFAYIFDSNIFRTQIQLSIKGVKVFSITQAILKNCLIWFPVIEEQQQIANYLDEKTSKIDILIEKSNKSIELLKEKRTALISAAVTGKIDVREKV
ncbi:restriction endonuclease subunit S [Aliarcobacter skirrowii]|uniref:restriction endonuclease subunit S n=1 Tax=Aliarcobacter skirrowii TaxID=28200 RepID=UPI0029B7ACBE|nr:restriction endonuclease subunit S [Aliarcobacter skirrowii]MDX4047376.1 restriction endonuclease subunit S [Aliarcobacter skirrowii]